MTQLEELTFFSCGSRALRMFYTGKRGWIVDIISKFYLRSIQKSSVGANSALIRTRVNHSGHGFERGAEMWKGRARELAAP